MAYPLKNQAVRDLIQIDLYKTPFLRTPMSWYSTIRHNDRPYLNAITLLADVVSFYLPVIERNEDGSIGAVQQRFAGDLLQRSYKQIDEQFGLTKKQARTAYQFLEEMGLIKLIFDTAITDRGKKLGNVMYIQLFPLEVLRITIEPLQFKLEEHETVIDNAIVNNMMVAEEPLEAIVAENTLLENAENGLMTGMEEPLDPSALQGTSPPCDFQGTTLVPSRVQGLVTSRALPLYPPGHKHCTNDPYTTILGTNDPCTAAAAGDIPVKVSGSARDKGSTDELTARARNGEADDVIWWNTGNEWVSRSAVEQVCRGYMSLDDWRDQTQIILGADTDRLLNLLHWLHYAQCSSLNSIDSDIKSVPAYIRARLHERPQLSGNDMVVLKRKISEQSTQYEFAY